MCMASLYSAQTKEARVLNIANFANFVRSLANCRSTETSSAIQSNVIPFPLNIDIIAQ